MIDVLLKFPDRTTGLELGLYLGYCEQSGATITAIPATLTFAVCEIGQYFVTSGPPDEQVITGDGNWWALIRGLGPTNIPPEATQFVMWDSDMGPRPDGMPGNQWL